MCTRSTLVFRLIASLFPLALVVGAFLGLFAMGGVFFLDSLGLDCRLIVALAWLGSVRLDLGF